MARKRIGEILIERGLVSHAQLDRALSERLPGQRVGSALLALGVLSEPALVSALGECQGLPVVDLFRVSPDWSALQLLRAPFCEQRRIFPLSLVEERGRRTLTVAMADPLDIPTITELERETRAGVRAVLATEEGIRHAIDRHYHGVALDVGPSGPMQLLRPGGELVAVSSEDFDVFLEDDVPLPTSVPAADAARMARIERRIDALIRLLESKGICSRDEALRLLAYD